MYLFELFHITLYRNTQSSLGPGFVSRYVNSRTSFLIRVHTSRGTVPLKRQPPKPVHNTSRGTVPLKRQPPEPVHNTSRCTVPLKRQPPKPVHNTSRGTVPLKRQPPKPVSQYSEQKLN